MLDRKSLACLKETGGRNRNNCVFAEVSATLPR